MFQWPGNWPEVCAPRLTQRLANKKKFQWPGNWPEVCARASYNSYFAGGCGFNGLGIGLRSAPSNRSSEKPEELVARVSMAWELA